MKRQSEIRYDTESNVRTAVNITSNNQEPTRWSAPGQISNDCETINGKFWLWALRGQSFRFVPAMNYCSHCDSSSITQIPTRSHRISCQVVATANLTRMSDLDYRKDD